MKRARWAFLAAAVATRAAGATPPAEARESPRELGGHVFLLSYYVPGPFATTAFGTTTIVGIGRAEAPRYDQSGAEIGVQEYTIGAAGQGFDYSVRLLPDVALRLVLDGIVYSGVNTRSAIVAGSTARYDLDLGLVGGRNFGRTRVAGVLSVSYRPEFSLQPAQAVLRAIEDDSFDEASAFQNVERLVIAPGVSAAWGPHPALGLVGEVRYLWSRRTGGDDPEEERQGLILGASLDFDLRPLLGVPLGILGVVRTRLPVGSEGLERRHEVGTGAFYTGRSHLLLGVEVVWSHGELRPDLPRPLDTDAAIATIRLRYYW